MEIGVLRALHAQPPTKFHPQRQERTTLAITERRDSNKKDASVSLELQIRPRSSGELVETSLQFVRPSLTHYHHIDVLDDSQTQLPATTISTSLVKDILLLETIWDGVFVNVTGQ